MFEARRAIWVGRSPDRLAMVTEAPELRRRYSTLTGHSPLDTAAVSGVSET